MCSSDLVVSSSYLKVARKVRSSGHFVALGEKEALVSRFAVGSRQSAQVKERVTKRVVKVATRDLVYSFKPSWGFKVES